MKPTICTMCMHGVTIDGYYAYRCEQCGEVSCLHMGMHAKPLCRNCKDKETDVVAFPSKVPRRFSLGKIYVTPGAAKLLARQGKLADDYISRHLRCDWGDVIDDDKAMNDAAVSSGDRIVSSYVVGDDKIWVITEWDRSATTVLLPEEY